MLKRRIEQDFKSAMLAGDKSRAEVLRGLKSAILYEEVAQKLRDTGLGDNAILLIIAREVKKRTESAEFYEKGGAPDRAQAEQSERAVLEEYLPAQMNDGELEKIVDGVMSELDSAQMGQIMSAVRQKIGQRADGKRIAELVKNKLQKT